MRPAGALVLLVMVMALGISSALAQGAEPWPDDPAAKPPLSDGAPFSLSRVPRTVHERPATPDELTIDVWYGLDQSFGEPGMPVPTANILGRVAGPQTVTSLSYTLNGGPEKPLSIGPDERRLFGAGDFIIELRVAELRPLPDTNTVIITAGDGQTQATATVTVRYADGNVWPLPYLADWSAVGSMLDAGDAITGLWTIENGLLRNVDSGYDRLVAIGDPTWTDYEVTVPLTVHSLNTCCWRGVSGGGGVGVIVRWPGHYDRKPDQQPMLGWRNLGGMAWYRWTPQGYQALELIGQDGEVIATRTDTPVLLGVEYVYKLRVKSSEIPGTPATYSFKLWPAAEPEPETWTLEAQGRPGEPASGSIILVAHQSQVTFGDVLVMPLDQPTLTVTTVPVENGRIEVTPPQASYLPGAEVTLEAVPDDGYLFAGWTNDVSGTENPLTVTLTESITVGATFEAEPDPETYRVYISPVATGTVGGLSYRRGDILEVDSLNRWTPLLQAAVGPLGPRSDIEAFTVLPDGSLAIALAYKLTVPGLGVVMPNDIIRLSPDASGSFDNGSVAWLVDGSDVGLTSTAQRIDALATAPDGRLVISTTGWSKLPGSGNATIRAADEDLIVFTAQTLGATTTGTWAVLCDGSTIPGLAGENVVGATLGPDGTTWYLNLSNRFNIGGTSGGNRDIVRLSSCNPGATAQIVWNSRNAGLERPFDAMTFLP